MLASRARRETSLQHTNLEASNERKLPRGKIPVGPVEKPFICRKVIHLGTKLGDLLPRGEIERPLTGRACREDIYLEVR
jgi:hypothetical protein